MMAGRLDRRVTFRRRAYIGPRQRGDFTDLVEAWGDYRRMTGREALDAGREVSIEEGTLRCRHPGPADEITIADRVVIDGRERAIIAIGTPDRRGGYIEFTVSTDAKP